jgi:hypothetical protein
MLAGFADEHVKQQIVEGLRRRGMDVVTAQEKKLRHTDDELLLQAATEEGRLMLTNDPDFLRIHHEWMLQGKSHTGIVFWEQTLAIGKAVRGILKYVQKTSPADAANYVHYL